MDAEARRHKSQVNPGFDLSTKLVLVSSPLFLSLPHAWRMLNLQTLANFRPEKKLEDMFFYLFMEICFSLGSLLVAVLADATVGLTPTLLGFLAAAYLAPVFTCLPNLFELDSDSSVLMLKYGCYFIGFSIIASVPERVFFVKLMDVHSPSFNLYCFLCYYCATVCQLLNSLPLFFPKLFPEFYHQNTHLIDWIQFIYQLIGWSVVVGVYCLIARLRLFQRSSIRGNSYKVIVCTYLTIYYSVKLLWSKMRGKHLSYQDSFEACEQWLPRSIVNETRKACKLFFILMCLMYSFGMELILKSIWSWQDENLSRRPKPSFLTVFPMEIGYLVYLAVLYPIVNYVILPFIKKKLHIRLSDLRLLGIALVFYNLSYIATMALEWRVMSAAADSAHADSVAIRVYNCMIYPVSWSVEHPGLTTAFIFLPAQMSRFYINNVAGTYRILIHSQVLNSTATVELAAGTSRVFVIRENALEPISEMNKQLDSGPSFQTDDVHLFVINGLSNSTKEYLDQKNVKLTWKAESDDPISQRIISNVTHLILKEATFEITLQVGNVTKQMNHSLIDFGVYSIMFHDSLDGTHEDYKFDTLSAGLWYSRGWANVQLLMLALAVAFGQIPMLRYTYKNAPPALLATCFSFTRVGAALATALVYVILSKYGLGPGPSTVSTMLIVLFTVLFLFLSMSDLIMTEEEPPKEKDQDDEDVEDERVIALQRRKSKVSSTDEPEKES